MGEIIHLHSKLDVRSVSPHGAGSHSVTVLFSRSLSDAEVINFWLAIKDCEISPTRPEGWEPSDKSDLAEWESAI